MNDFEAMLDDIRASTVGDNSYLNDLDAEARARRLALRRSIEASLPHRETAQEAHDRERFELRQKETDTAREAEQAEAARRAQAGMSDANAKRLIAAINELVDARVEAKCTEMLRDFLLGDDHSDLLAVLMVNERGRANVAIKTAIDGLRRELNEKIVVLRERWIDARPNEDRVERAIEKTAVKMTAAYEARIEAMERALQAEVDEMKARAKAAVGRFPVARPWAAETVTYAGALVTYGGQTWQARQDTAKRPQEGEDWACIAERGRDGIDGKSPTYRGPYSVAKKYTAFDVLSFGPDLFVSLRNGAGVCPGEGWRQIAPKGLKGEKGERGAKGERGKAEERVTIREWLIDAPRYRVAPLLSNGQSAGWLNLRPLFAQFGFESGTASG